MIPPRKKKKAARVAGAMSRFYHVGKGKQFLIYQLGTNNWQRDVSHIIMVVIFACFVAMETMYTVNSEILATGQGGQN